MTLDIIEKLPDCSLWAFDETGKRLESNNYYSWGLKGQYKHIERNGVKKGLNIIGATEILRHNQSIYDSYEKGTENNTNISSVEVIRFLRKLLEYDQKRGITKTFVILDNARFHRSKDVREFAKQHRTQLYLIFQPKYSPQLNPQENMWKWLKSYLAIEKAFGTVTELSDGISEFYHYANSHPELIEKRTGARHYYK